MNATLIEATLSDHPMIQNMGRFYVYDMSRYCGLSGSVFDWSVPADGLFECIDLKKYFGCPDRFAFLFKVGEETAGFALINKTGTSPDVLGLLTAHDYPGNVRELQNIIEHAFVLLHEGQIELEHLPGDLVPVSRPSTGGRSILESVKAVEPIASR